jgi:AraC-like DNA-binding protein
MRFHVPTVGHPGRGAGSRNAQTCARIEQRTRRAGQAAEAGAKSSVMNALWPASPHDDDPRARTLERLRALGRSVEVLSTPPGPGDEPRGHLLRYTCKERQRLSSLVFESPWIVVVLEGRKRLEGEQARTVEAGEAILFATRTPLTVTNVPDPASGYYHALCLEVTAEARALLERHHPDLGGTLAGWFGASSCVVTPGVPALQAFEHVCETILTPTAHPRLLHHQLEGLLLALLVEADAHTRALPAAQARTDLVMAVRNLVAEGLESTWDGRGVARRLGLSPATLRRRLAGEGTSVRSILLHLRMSLARTLLSDGRSTVAEVALRCGYESPAKFSRQFARWSGSLPSAMRPRAARAA